MHYAPKLPLEFGQQATVPVSGSGPTPDLAQQVIFLSTGHQLKLFNNS